MIYLFIYLFIFILFNRPKTYNHVSFIAHVPVVDISTLEVCSIFLTFGVENLLPFVIIWSKFNFPLQRGLNVFLTSFFKVQMFELSCSVSIRNQGRKLNRTNTIISCLILSSWLSISWKCCYLPEGLKHLRKLTVPAAAWPLLALESIGSCTRDANHE